MKDYQFKGSALVALGLGLVGAMSMAGITSAPNSHFNSNEIITRSEPVFGESVKIIDHQPAYATKAAASDSIDININVTYASNNETVSLLFIFPREKGRIPYGLSGKKTAYTHRTLKGEYDIVLYGDKENNLGNMFYYTGTLNLQSDTTLTINTADVTIETPIRPILPNGEEVKQDLYVSSTKEVAEWGNVHTGTKTFFAIEYAPTNLHLTHVTYFISYQKYKPDSQAITDSRKNPYIWTNRKDLPLNIFQLHRFVGPLGTMGVRYDIHPGEYGNTITNTKESWKKIDFKYGKLDSADPVEGFDPALLNGNGMTFWHDGMQCSSSMGYSTTYPGDMIDSYWLSATPNNTENGYDFVIHPARSIRKVGSTIYGYCPNPITMGKDGISFVPFQYLYPGLKIWAGSDGVNLYIPKCANTRIHTDAQTIWGE